MSMKVASSELKLTKGSKSKEKKLLNYKNKSPFFYYKLEDILKVGQYCIVTRCAILKEIQLNILKMVNDLLAYLVKMRYESVIKATRKKIPVSCSRYFDQLVL